MLMVSSPFVLILERWTTIGRCAILDLNQYCRVRSSITLYLRLSPSFELYHQRCGKNHDSLPHRRLKLEGQDSNVHQS